MTALDTTAREHVQAEPVPAEAVTYGVAAEFDDVTTVVLAARAMRDAGFTRWDVHSPFPIHGIDNAMGIKPTILPWIVFVCGAAGTITGLVLTLFTMASQFEVNLLLFTVEGYEFLVSGKPLASLPAYIPVIFELTILFASFGAVFGMLILNGLPMLYHPLFRSQRFRRVTTDRFFITVEARDPRYDRQNTSALLREHGAISVEVVEE